MQQRWFGWYPGIVLAIVLAEPAVAENVSVSIRPEAPTSSDVLYVDVTIPALCAPVIDASRSTITMEGGTVRVSLATFGMPHPCDTFGDSRSFEIGRLPAGEFTVQVEVDGIEDMPDIEPGIDPVPISITGAGILDRFATGFDLSGLWWDSSDPGWSLMIEQMPDGDLAGLFATYAEDGSNRWFMLLPGTWTDGYYVAPIALTDEGPWFGRHPPPGQGLIPQLPTVRVAGEARIFASVGPGAIHSGGIAYTIDGMATTRYLQRFTF